MQWLNQACSSIHFVSITGQIWASHLDLWDFALGTMEAKFHQEHSFVNNFPCSRYFDMLFRNTYVCIVSSFLRKMKWHSGLLEHATWFAWISIMNFAQMKLFGKEDTILVRKPGLINLFYFLVAEHSIRNKKVLLRERKRHTAHHVASTWCAALSLGEGVPHPAWWGTPILRDRGYPHPANGGLFTGTPIQPYRGAPPRWTLDGVHTWVKAGWHSPPKWMPDGDTRPPPPSEGWMGAPPLWKETNR